MNLIGEYIKYKLSNKGKHQIHSPFVFDFVSNCLKIGITENDKSLIRLYENSLKRNNQEIEIQDFGAGSKKMTNKRKISKIYKTVSAKGVYAKLLYQLNKHYLFENVLEFGTSLGVGTLHLALGNQNSNIITVDACKNTSDFAQENLNNLAIQNVNFLRNTFYDFLLAIKGETIKFDLIYIDGHHDGEALQYYWKELAKHIHEETLIILDDIRWSESMLVAWNKIIENENYHLTMDLFRMGIISKRPKQAKEHFVIKLKGILRGMI
jgi:predicted O-methyltransferase YrrM